MRTCRGLRRFRRRLFDLLRLGLVRGEQPLPVKRQRLAPKTLGGDPPACAGGCVLGNYLSTARRIARRAACDVVLIERNDGLRARHVRSGGSMEADGRTGGAQRHIAIRTLHGLHVRSARPVEFCR